MAKVVKAKKIICLRLSEYQIEYLRKLSIKSGIGLSLLIRQCLAEKYPESIDKTQKI